MPRAQPAGFLLDGVELAGPEDHPARHGLPGEREHRSVPGGLPVPNISCRTSQEPAVHVDPHRLRLGVLIHRGEAHLASVAGLADAAER